MSKKRSTEDVIVSYFTDASLEAATLMLAIVKGIVKRKSAAATTAPEPVKRVVRRRRRTAPAEPAAEAVTP